MGSSEQKVKFPIVKCPIPLTLLEFPLLGSPGDMQNIIFEIDYYKHNIIMEPLVDKQFCFLRKKYISNKLIQLHEGEDGYQLVKKFT